LASDGHSRGEGCGRATIAKVAKRAAWGSQAPRLNCGALLSSSAVAEKAEAGEADQHHRPCGRLGDGGRWRWRRRGRGQELAESDHLAGVIDTLRFALDGVRQPSQVDEAPVAPLGGVIAVDPSHDKLLESHSLPGSIDAEGPAVTEVAGGASHTGEVYGGPATPLGGDTVRKEIKITAISLRQGLIPIGGAALERRTQAQEFGERDNDVMNDTARRSKTIGHSAMGQEPRARPLDREPRVVALHQGQRTQSAPTGRTYDRRPPAVHHRNKNACQGAVHI
jgi:hypothetical protein